MNRSPLQKPLTLTKIFGTNDWIVASTRCHYQIPEEVSSNYKNIVYVVPLGFITDLASVPRSLWAIFPPSGIYTEASVIHDHMYSTRNVPRKIADKTYLHNLKMCGVGYVRRNLMYNALRLFARGNYKRD